MEVDIINALGAIEAGESQLAQVSAQSANAVIQSEERKQQAYRETADAYEKISRDTSLTRDDADFKKVFEAQYLVIFRGFWHKKTPFAAQKVLVFFYNSPIRRTSGEKTFSNFLISSSNFALNFFENSALLSSSNKPFLVNSSIYLSAKSFVY